MPRGLFVGAQDLQLQYCNVLRLYKNQLHLSTEITVLIRDTDRYFTKLKAQRIRNGHSLTTQQPLSGAWRLESSAIRSDRALRKPLRAAWTVSKA